MKSPAVNEKKVMRDVLIENICNRMHSNKKIFFLSADFGSPKLDRLRLEFKDRFINVGIAEQNLINVATGLALEGYIVYAYTISSFLSMRAFEQIRVNLALHAQLKNININLIGVGAGLSYEVSGPTHHCLEDIVLMRALPNIALFSPSDYVLVDKFLDYSLKNKFPKYLRLEGKSVGKIYENTSVLNIEDSFCEIISGKNLCVISTGFMTQKALKIIKELEGEGIKAGLIDIFLLKPFKAKEFAKVLSKYKSAITLEEGFSTGGGIDGLVLGIVNKNRLKIDVETMGFKDAYVFELGTREYLHSLNNLDEKSIKNCIRRKFNR